MQIKLEINTRRWFMRFPQAGAKSGWSDWVSMTRYEALNFIEMGWEYETDHNA